MGFHYASKRKTEWYLRGFRDLFSFATKAANEVELFFKSYRKAELGEFRARVHRIEHEADARRKALVEKVMEDRFLPFRRTDIYEIVNLIDDVTDAIEEISLRCYLYEFEALPHDSVEYMELNIECLEKCRAVLRLFDRKPRKEGLLPLIEDVARLEEQGDAEYLNDMTLLHRSSKDPLYIMETSEFYSCLEKVSDTARELVSYLGAIIYRRGR